MDASSSTRVVPPEANKPDPMDHFFETPSMQFAWKLVKITFCYSLIMAVISGAGWVVFFTASMLWFRSNPH